MHVEDDLVQKHVLETVTSEIKWMMMMMMILK
jgi:hypothetical protein